MNNKTGWSASRIGSHTVRVQTFLLFSEPHPKYQFIPLNLDPPRADVLGIKLIKDQQRPEANNRFMRSVEGLVENVPTNITAMVISEDEEETVVVPIVN